MDKTQRIILLLLTLILYTGLMGCQSKSETTQTPSIIPTEIPTTIKPTAVNPPTSTGEKTVAPSETPDVEEEYPEDEYSSIDPTGQVITISHHYSSKLNTSLEEIIKDFNSTNEWGISVNINNVDSYDEMINELMQGGNSDQVPDIIAIQETQAAKIWLADGLVDINRLMNHPEWGMPNDEIELFYPGYLNSGVIQALGEIQLNYPLFGKTNVVYYNIDWLTELGYTGYSETPEIFVEASCKAVAKPFRGRTTDRSIGTQVNLSLSSLTDWVRAFGGSVFDSSKEEYNFNTISAVNAMTFLQDLFKKNCASHLQAENESIENFGKGGLLFSIDSIEKISDYRDSVQSNSNFNWQISSLPQVTNNPTANISIFSAGITKTTPERQLASWLFLKYFSTAEIQASWVQKTNTLPVRRDTALHLETFFKQNTAYQMALDFLNRGSNETSIIGESEIQSLSMITLEKIMKGSNVVAILDQLTMDSNQIYNEQLSMMPEKVDQWEAINPEDQEIVFWHPYIDQRKEIIDEITNGFNQKNNWGIQVVPESKNGFGELFLNMLAVSGSEESPDLILAYQFQAAAYYQIGGIIDLNSLVKSDKWGLTQEEKEDFYPSIFGQDIFPVFNMVRLGYPIQRSMDVLYYNTEWMNELGFQDPPKTLMEFKTMSCAAAATPFSRSNVNNPLGYYFYIDSTRFSSWLFANGGDIFNEDAQEYTYNNGTANNLLALLLDLVETGCILPITDRQEVQDAFSTGRVLFMVDSTFHIPTISNLVENNNGFQWNIAPIPTNENGPTQNLFGTSASIPQTSQKKELAAWIFLKYITSPEVQAQWVSSSLYLPIRTSALNFMGEQLNNYPSYSNATNLMDFSLTEPSLPGYDLVGQEVELALQAIFDGSDIIETLDSLTAIANRILTLQLER